MSCNGCRVLRKGCSETCVLRSCLHWIDSPEAQGNATLFLAKFFGRSDLMSLISAVPHHHRSALFQSLLYEACGRTVNPVNGAVGLLSGGNWHVCQAAVQTVLAGGTLRPIPGVLTALWRPSLQDESSEHFYAEASTVRSAYTQWQPWIVSNVREEDRECGLGLPPTMRPRGGRRGKGRSYQVAVGRPSACPPASFYSGESETTSLESGEDDPRIQGVQQQRELLNLFV